MLCIREEEMRGQATASGSCSINARARVSGGGHIQGPRDGRCAVMRVYGLELRIRLHAPTTRQARVLYPLKSYRLAPLLAKIMTIPVSFSLTALQDTSSVPPTARQSVWQQAQKRVFMEKDYNSCRGDKPALPPTSSTSLPCCA